MNGSNPAVQNPSESFLYAQQNKTGPESREGSTAAPVTSRGMVMYDRDQMQRSREIDDDGHGGKKGFWGLCCRG
jgi:casein kinase 1